MKRLLFFILALQICFAAGVSAKWNRGKVTLMTYNIKAGAGLDDVRDYARSAQIVAQAMPDICALQEVDSVTRRSGGIDGAMLMAERLGMHAEFARAIRHDGGAYGVALLSKEKPLRVERIPLPGREEARVALVAEFSKYVVVTTHLSLNKQDQTASVEILTRKAAEFAGTKPVFVLGDMNHKPNSQQFNEMAAAFTLLTDPSEPTFPSDKPRECIDYVWGSGRGEVEYTASPIEFSGDLTVSDHRPLAVEVRFSKQVPKSKKRK